MEKLDLLSVALGLACLAGINLYLTVFVTGLAIHFHWITLAPQYQSLEVLGNPWIITIAGILYFLTALGAVAGVVHVLANSVALVFPSLGGPIMRVVVMFAVYGLLVVINIRGVREGAGAVTVITIAKLLPLLLFIGAGIFFIHGPNLSWSGWPLTR